jgi:hypothetical protein
VASAIRTVGDINPINGGPQDAAGAVATIVQNKKTVHNSNPKMNKQKLCTIFAPKVHKKTV